MRHLWRATILCLAALAPLGAQTASAPREFEVVSIRRNLSGDRGFNVNAAPGGRVVATNAPIRNLIQNTHRVQDFQLVGGPDWLATERWDIVASAGGSPNREQMLEMLRHLIVTRFKVVTHRESREMPAYALVVARRDGLLGPQLNADAFDCAKLPPGAQSCGTDLGPGIMTTMGSSMDEIAARLARVVGIPVVNETKLAGQYRFQLTWAPDASPAEPTAAGRSVPDGPSFFTALHEQLGLKMESRRLPTDVLVIDSAERPDVN